jgi:hypothetical protein
VKFNLRDPVTGRVDLRAYASYLEREREALSAHVRGVDLLTIERVFSDGPGCFHDSRFDRLSITTSGTERPGSHAQILDVELRLRGPFFDRYFELSYKEVSSCHLQAPAPDDDLLIHEVRMEDGSLVHELLFDHDQTIAISCRELLFREILDR